MIEPALEPAIDAFIAVDSAMPTVSAVFRAHGATIRAAELKHYRLLLSGRLDESYAASCVELCNFIASIGLTPRVRITCGNKIVRAILDLVSRRHPLSSRRVARDVTLLTGALAFDMATIMSTFDDAAMLARNARQEVIDTAIGDFQAAVGSVIGNLQSAAGVLSGQTAAMLGGVGETNRRTQSAAHTTTIVRDNVDAAINSSSELESSIAEISRQGLSSLDMARLGGEDAKASMRVMNELAAAAKEIGSVTRSISALADQTNLLSLNATIEAARAGAAGRGFAVVAAEVQSLSQQTHSAAKKIADQIAAVQEASTKTIDQIATVVNRMGEIALITSAISSAVCEQEAATRSIVETVRRTASVTSQASDDVEAIESIAFQNVKAAEEIAAWANRLTEDAGELSNHVGVFFARVRQA